MRSYEHVSASPAPQYLVLFFPLFSRLLHGPRALCILKSSKSILPFYPPISPFLSFALRSYPQRTPHLFLSRSHPYDANTLKLIHKTSMYNHLLLSTVCECFSEVSFFFILPSFFLLFLLFSFTLSLSLPPIRSLSPAFQRVLSRVSVKYVLFHDSTLFLTPRVLVIVLLVRASVCVCVY